MMAERFGFALSLPEGHRKIANMVSLFGNGEVFGVIDRCGRDELALGALDLDLGGESSGAAASALLGILQLALDQHHKYLGVESQRWVQLVVPKGQDEKHVQVR